MLYELVVKNKMISLEICLLSLLSCGGLACFQYLSCFVTLIFRIGGNEKLKVYVKRFQCDFFSTLHSYFLPA